MSKSNKKGKNFKIKAEKRISPKISKTSNFRLITPQGIKKKQFSKTICCNTRQS